MLDVDGTVKSYWEVKVKSKLKWLSPVCHHDWKGAANHTTVPAIALRGSCNVRLPMLFSFLFMYIKKYNIVLNSRTVNSGTHNTTLKNQNSLVKQRRETAHGLHGGKVPMPTALVRNGSAL